MTRKVTIATLQFECTKDVMGNIERAERMIRNAAANGAQVIVLQELFEMMYICQIQYPKFFKHAEPVNKSGTVHMFSNLAKELGVVIPIPFFEKDGNNYYNSVAVADADGSIVGVYRKTHIPQSECYEEKFYFTPSNNPYRVFETKFGKMGVLICWDQWFSEAAKCLALQGADFIVYPTAIGTEPEFPDGETYLHWARTITGHAAATGVPVIVANRIGHEELGGSEIDFYGGSFIADGTGAVVTQVGGVPQENGGVDPNPVELKGYTKYTFDLDALENHRAFWGLYRDRRPELYGRLVRQ
ncbi:N-carbamoylputrescine amidase [Paramecium bursaria Chlorella virus NY2B]|uniref:N-carbamoylputrescine amidase n=1 Tax=Paramecium bursaria Chlorella virus NYs1 TaxID=83442 RepID=M1I7Y3_9PHYC|nr:NAD synthetase [Paramecium bursaria Chlorella virus AR158]YP_009665249.1 NAD synthetase [Paramecium bursaria Chlorella virus NYs1]AGE54123.1 N-carbamoylputrescine amidase [Paramecium bursaria Chlorella virus IL-5-2s1]AGE58233.1 N-carbamoylputrescine amidase [Paramecium bursaria Chlorella virus NY2B]ABU43650.1 hypothetical protein AR158_C104R [Paramecium bursaria Chlorella virus AR158]AGE58604.1 N-carbamoylputrescine amidase [Paramecium bursaria Chlorella virus NYs1]